MKPTKARPARSMRALGVCAAGLLLQVATCAAGPSLTDLVNPFIGTEPSPGSQFGIAFDTGNVFPGAVAPRRIQSELFTARPSGLPGNDDAGSLSSWYVLSALGVYPMIPGVGGLAVSSPAFAKATIHLQNGAKLEIIGANASEENCYVQSLKVNGKEWGSSWLPWKEVAGGGTLEFTLGKEPSAWGTKADQLPAGDGLRDR